MSKIRSSWIGKISTTILHQLKIVCTMGFGNRNITTFSIPKCVLNAQTMFHVHYHYITTKTKSAQTFPPQPHYNQYYHQNHTTITTTTIIILQQTFSKPHCKQGSNVRTSIFLLCPLKDSGTFILALRPTTTTAAKTHSRYPPFPPKKVINQDKIRNYLPRNKFTCTSH